MALLGKLGIVPILWNNDDLPDFRVEITPFREVLDAIAAAGFEGTELGGNYPRAPELLGPELARRELSLVTGYFEADFTLPNRLTANLEAARHLAGFLLGMGCHVMVVADVKRPQRLAVAGRLHGPGMLGDRPFGLSESEWIAMAQGLEALGRMLDELGLALAFHNHAGTGVETEGEIERLLSLTDPRWVGFCPDTGHLTYAGADAVAVVRRHASRVRHVHLKDVDPRVLAEVRTERLSFLEALRRGIFCPPGHGIVDLRGTLRVLDEAGYPGWLVAEQDTDPGNDPGAAALKASQHLRSLLGRTHAHA